MTDRTNGVAAELHTFRVRHASVVLWGLEPPATIKDPRLYTGSRLMVLVSSSSRRGQDHRIIANTRIHIAVALHYHYVREHYGVSIAVCARNEVAATKHPLGQSVPGHKQTRQRPQGDGPGQIAGA